jgi:hypothetical protein
MSDNPNPTPAPQPEPQTFPLAYVQELRRENESWRNKAQGHKTDAEASRQAAEEAARKAEAAEAAAQAAAEAKIAEALTAAETKANERILRVELRAAAIKAGMVDLDGLKLLDTSSLKINDDGDVEGADALIEAAKKAKPYLFGAPGTSNPTPAPPPKPPTAKTARDMTDAEYRAARKAIDATGRVPK